jgi:hypothetical protein
VQRLRAIVECSAADLFCDSHTDVLARSATQQPQDLVRLQVDGQVHFCASPWASLDRPLGTTVARRMMLRSRDFCVVSVPTRTWHALPRDAGAKHMWLLGLMDAACAGDDADQRVLQLMRPATG